MNLQNIVTNKGVKGIGALFIVWVLVTFIGAGLVLHGLLRVPAPVANTVAIIVILLLTQAVYKKEGKDISELGLGLKWDQLRFILPGFLAGAVFVVVLVSAYSVITGFPLVYNPGFDGWFLLTGLWTVLPTVLLEELAFRGICFKRAIELGGVSKANAIFGAVFIISHWVNMPVFDIAQAIVLMITGLGHWLYATALLRSRTLYFPIALHYGNNWLLNIVFSVQQKDSIGMDTNPSVMQIMSEGPSNVLDSTFFATTAVTAVLFLLMILLISRYRRGPTKHSSSMRTLEKSSRECFENNG